MHTWFAICIEAISAQCRLSVYTNGNNININSNDNDNGLMYVFYVHIFQYIRVYMIIYIVANNNNENVNIILWDVCLFSTYVYITDIFRPHCRMQSQTQQANSMESLEYRTYIYDTIIIVMLICKCKRLKWAYTDV